MDEMQQGTGSDRRAFLKKMAALGGGAIAASTVLSFTLDGTAGALVPVGGGSNGTIGGGSNGTIGRCDRDRDLGGGSNGTVGGRDKGKDRDDDRDDWWKPAPKKPKGRR